MGLLRLRRHSKVSNGLLAAISCIAALTDRVNDRYSDKPDLCGCSMIRFIGGKRWIVERTFTGITTNRRLATDFEPFAAIVQALI
jgi:hypothetical protein